MFKTKLPTPLMKIHPIFLAPIEAVINTISPNKVTSSVLRLYHLGEVKLDCHMKNFNESLEIIKNVLHEEFKVPKNLLEQHCDIIQLPQLLKQMNIPHDWELDLVEYNEELEEIKNLEAWYKHEFKNCMLNKWKPFFSDDEKIDSIFDVCYMFNHEFGNGFVEELFDSILEILCKNILGELEIEVPFDSEKLKDLNIMDIASLMFPEICLEEV